jgi:hypothetical protein
MYLRGHLAIVVSLIRWDYNGFNNLQKLTNSLINEQSMKKLPKEKGYFETASVTKGSNFKWLDTRTRRKRPRPFWKESPKQKNLRWCLFASETSSSWANPGSCCKWWCQARRPQCSSPGVLVRTKVKGSFKQPWAVLTSAKFTPKISAITLALATLGDVN